jgi:hypothetical protein
MRHTWQDWRRTPLARLLSLVVLIGLALFAPSGGLYALAMAAPTTSKTELDPIMKVLANRPLFQNIVDESEFMDIIKTESNGIKSDTTTGGRYIENAHITALMSGYRGASDGGYIAQAESPVFKNTRVYLKQMTGTIQMTGSAMRQVRTDEAAFVNYLEEAMPLFAKRIAHDDDRMLLGFGYDIRARVVSIAGGGPTYTVVMKDTLGVSGWTEPWLEFSEGDQCVFTASLAAPIALRNPGTTQRAVVRDMDEATNTITFEMDAGLAGVIAANDYVGTGDNIDHSFPHGNPNVAAVPTGFLGGVDDGTVLPTYMNLARSANRWLKGIVIDASAAPWNGAISEQLVTYAWDETHRRGAGAVDAFATSYSAERGLRNSFKSDRFFMDPRTYVGGRLNTYLQLGNRAILIRMARKLPPEVFFGIERGSWTRFTLGEYEWDDTTGAIWNRVTDSSGPKDAYYATGWKYEEWFCGAPRHNFRIQGLTTNN